MVDRLRRFAEFSFSLRWLNFPIIGKHFAQQIVDVWGVHVCLARRWLLLNCRQLICRRIWPQMSVKAALPRFFFDNASLLVTGRLSNCDTPCMCIASRDVTSLTKFWFNDWESSRLLKSCLFWQMDSLNVSLVKFSQLFSLPPDSEHKVCHFLENKLFSENKQGLSPWLFSKINAAN